MSFGKMVSLFGLGQPSSLGCVAKAGCSLAPFDLNHRRGSGGCSFDLLKLN